MRCEFYKSIFIVRKNQEATTLVMSTHPSHFQFEPDRIFPICILSSRHHSPIDLCSVSKLMIPIMYSIKSFLSIGQSTINLKSLYLRFIDSFPCLIIPFAITYIPLIQRCNFDVPGYYIAYSLQGFLFLSYITVIWSATRFPVRNSNRVRKIRARVEFETRSIITYIGLHAKYFVTIRYHSCI